ncbi:MAG TPA: restriction endonuclease subunit M, partial [Candidatus Bathyarchaeia archaeon]
KKKAEAQAEVEAKYKDEIATRIAVLEADIAAAKNDKQRKVELIKALRDYRREMDAKIKREARVLLKERFAYCIFLYEAEKVGITATGEDDQNELYPNSNIPSGVEKTALELHREFREDPESFLLAENAA